MHSDCTQDWVGDHGFGQGAQKPQERRVLAVVILTLAVMLVEIVVGWFSGSMALLADGVHMGTHALALGMAYVAFVLARRHAENRRFSFGTGKLGELAGFSSALLLAASALLVAAEAIWRLFDPQPIAYREAIAVAALGLIVNVVSAAMLIGKGHHHDDDHHHDNNTRAAILHVMADAVTSVAALAALLAAWQWGWNWLDPVAALVAAGLIMVWGFDLARDTAAVLLDREAPETLRQRVRMTLESDGDSRVVDLHLWSVGPGIWTLVASVVTHRDRQPSDYKRLLPGDLALHHPIIEVQFCR
jgi:cation diffusion facilitator family transporter